MLEMKNITKIYNPGTVQETCLFRDFSLTINKGSFVSVVGSNGSGKTSMLNLLCGSIPVDAGQILMDGQDITRVLYHRPAERTGNRGTDAALCCFPSCGKEPGHRRFQ